MKKLDKLIIEGLAILLGASIGFAMIVNFELFCFIIGIIFSLVGALYIVANACLLFPLYLLVLAIDEFFDLFFFKIKAKSLIIYYTLNTIFVLMGIMVIHLLWLWIIIGGLGYNFELSYFIEQLQNIE